MVIEKPCVDSSGSERGWNRLGSCVSRTCLRVKGRKGGDVV